MEEAEEVLWWVLDGLGMQQLQPLLCSCRSSLIKGNHISLHSHGACPRMPLQRTFLALISASLCPPRAKISIRTMECG